MLRFVLKRVVQAILTLFIVATSVFLLLRLMPEEGYFAEGYDRMDREQIDAALAEMGLKDPLHVQIAKFYEGIFHGDLGTSITVRPKVPVLDIIAPKIPYSLYFGLASIVVSLALGLPLGVLMARYKGKFMDGLGNGYIILIKAVPAAVYYLFLQLYVTKAFNLPMLFKEGKVISWILPLICMSLGGIASYAMWMRRYMVDQLNMDYIKFSRAKGMGNSAIMFKHVVRNAFVPMAHNLPSTILFTISGSIYIESLFSIPGMGGLLVSAIQRQDNTLVQALVLIYSTIGVFGLLLGDLLMALCDPRIKLDKKGAGR